MRVFRCLALISFLALGLQTDAFAQKTQNRGGAQSGGTTQKTEKLTFGYGIICNTSQQIQRYLTLYQGKTTAEEAAQAVNVETKNPGGCGMASIAFIAGDYLGEVNVSGGQMRMVQIVVLAMETEKGWQRVPPTVQYTALFLKLEEA